MPKCLVASTIAVAVSVGLFGSPCKARVDAATIERPASASPYDDGAWEDETWRVNIAQEGLPAGGFLAGGAIVPDAPEPGFPIKLVTWVRNVAGGWALPMYCWHGPSWLQIRDESGIRIPMRKEGEAAWRSRWGSGTISPAFLPPGYAVGRAVALDQLFDLSKPGVYTLLLSYNTGVTTAVAKRIRFEVRKRVGSVRSPHPSTPVAPATEITRLSGRHSLDWEDVQRFVGRDHQGLVLNSLMSPVARDEIWLVFSLQNVDLGNREAYAKKDLVPGVCFICRGKSVSLDGGGGASDYRILLRDATGKTQIFSPADVNCYEHGQDITLHSLAPGDAVGFAVPMDKVFALRAGQRYTAVVALKSKTDDTIVCASHPVTFVAPPTQIIGVTRPPYGSERIWELLVSKLNKTPAALSLKSEVKRDYGHGVYLTSRLVNQNDKAFVPQSSRYTSLDRSLILVTDESGRFLPTNRSTSIDDLASPYYTRQTIPVGGTGNPCDYPLHLLFPLRAGNSYTVLIAQNAWSKSGDSIAVGRPLAFTVPDKNYATCFRSDSVAAVPCFARKPVAHPPTITERWSVLLHHAGEPFDGIDLKARVLGQVVPTGKQIQVGVSFQNAAGHPVCIRRLSGEAAYDVLIRNVASGEITELPIENRLQATLWVDTRTLGSGEIVNEMLHLDELNKIQKQGDYEVLIAMSLVGDVDAVYVAKPLRVRVGT